MPCPRWSGRPRLRRPGRRSARWPATTSRPMPASGSAITAGSTPCGGRGGRARGYVRWAHPSNRGFLRCLDGLRSAAGAIGESDEEERCAQFLHPARSLLAPRADRVPGLVGRARGGVGVAGDRPPPVGGAGGAASPAALCWPACAGQEQSGPPAARVATWVHGAGAGAAIGTLRVDAANVSQALARHDPPAAIKTVCALLTTDAETAIGNLPTPDEPSPPISTRPTRTRPRPATTVTPARAAPPRCWPARPGAGPAGDPL